MAHEFKFVRTIEFSETDMAGIVHFWPRVHTSFDFKKPLRFEDEIEIHLLVSELRSKSITYQFRFNKLNGAERELAATGKLTVVCVSRAVDGTMKACDIPAEIADKIEVASADLLES